MDLIDRFGKKIDAACRALKRVAKPKSQSESVKALQDLLRIATEIDWKAFTEAVDEQLLELQRQHEREMAGRREAILRVARERNMLADRRENEDQVGIFRLKYSGEKITAFFAGEEVASFSETAAERILTKLEEAKRKLGAAPYSREDFFNLVKRALERTQHTSPAKFRDGCISIMELHLEVLFDMALASDRFRKRPNRERFPDYSRLQFLYDFARFEAEGMIVGDLKLACKTPTLAQADNRVSIPRLSEPLAPGIQVYLVQLQKVTDL